MRRTLVGVLASFVLAAALPATATAADDDPIEPPFPGHSLCHVPLELEPPTPGELPEIEDPVIGTSVGVACSPDVGDFAANGETVVTTEVTEWGFVTNNAGQLTGQVRLTPTISPVETGDILSRVTVTYKVTVGLGAAARTEMVTVDAGTLQGGGPAVGGTNVTSFNPPIPANTWVFVELVSGSGSVKIGGVTQRGFTIKAANQGAKVRP